MKLASVLRAALLVAVPFTFLSGTVSAANIVNNPGFETGDFTGWTTHICTGACTFQAFFVASGVGQASTFAADTACVGVACLDPITGDWLSQVLTTTAATSYTFSFWTNPGTSANSPTVEADVYWNGVQVGGFVNEPAGYSQFTISGLVATGSTSVLEITARHDPADLFIDNICVSSTGDCGAVVAGVPEPFSFALTGFGLAAVGFARFRRRKV